MGLQSRESACLSCVPSTGDKSIWSVQRYLKVVCGACGSVINPVSHDTEKGGKLLADLEVQSQGNLYKEGVSFSSSSRQRVEEGYCPTSVPL